MVNKAAALDAMSTSINSAEEAVATEITTFLPAVTIAMHETKNEVRRALTIEDPLRMCQGLLRCCQVRNCTVHHSR